MATSVWNDGGADGDWSNAANWTGGVPASTDIAILAMGSRSIILGLAQGAITLAALIITDEYTGAVATLGSPLVINATDVRIAGTPASGGIFLNGTFTDFVVTDGPTSSGATGVSLDGTIGTLRIYQGNLSVVDGAAITTIECGSGENSTINLTIGAGVTALTDLRLMGGTTNLGSACTNIWGMKGTLNITEGAIGRLEIMGATVKYTSNDTLNTLRIYTGKLDLTDAVTVGLTITNSHIWNGILDMQNGLGNEGITFTNPLRIHSNNASVLRDKGVAA